MKNLVAEIKTGHRDRTTKIGEIKRETQDILGEADAYMKRVTAELKDAAKNLKDFLVRSEETRKKDFSAMMEGIQAKIKEIKVEVKDFLAKSEGERIANFKATMEDINNRIGEIKDRVREIRKSAKGTIGDYKRERKAAAGYWASLQGKGEVVPSAPAVSKRGRKRKKII